MFMVPTAKPRETIRVLHVDDEPDHLKLTKLFLEKADAGLKVESVSSAEEARHLLQKRSFDCVVSDYVLSGMDGIEFAREVRKADQVPFILYTGQVRRLSQPGSTTVSKKSTIRASIRFWRNA